MTAEFPFPADAPLAGRYAVERELSRGGMGIIYLARDIRHDRPVAIKVLRPEVAATLGADRFLLEIRVTARLQHAHILPLLDSGLLETTSGSSVPFYVMPYVEGESLRERLRRERRLPEDEALRIAGQVADALAYAHEQGVIHRDVKPENILLSGGPAGTHGNMGRSQALVADFGIAQAASLASGDRLTGTGLALGTAHYMSPEQVAGERTLDGRADVYALGCVLYEMLAGEPPFTGPTAQAIAARTMAESTPLVRRVRPDVPEAVERVIARALAKAPADRFAGAAEFGDALARAAATPALPRRWAAPWWRRGAALAIVVLAVAGIGLLRRDGRAGDLVPSASSIAVLPFTPSTADTALSRLGRDLAFTLSAELDGLGSIRVVDAHTVLAHVRSGESSAEGEHALARTLGVGSMVRGSLVRVASNVRLDLALVSVDSGTPLASATVTAPPDSVAALTDSAARALVVQIWSHGPPPTPSLDGALRTRSVPALRAFLQGEGEITRGEWDDAATSYQQALDADPTFWLAYARHVYARYWTLRQPDDSVVARLEQHRAELPERDRLSAEAIILLGHDSLPRAIEQARTATERYHDSWLGWLIDADLALHYGPINGGTLSDARAAFERAVALNPQLIPAWEHLMLDALVERDTAASARAFVALTRLDAGGSFAPEGLGDRMRQFRFLRAIQVGDNARAGALTDSIARDPAPLTGPTGNFYDAYRYGWYARQIGVSQQALAADPAPQRQRMETLLLALSWGARGAWDSTLVILDRSAAAGTDSTAAIRAYGLAALGAWLDVVDPREAAARRQAAVGAIGDDVAGRAELAWIDGVAAAARKDRRGIEDARAALRRSSDPGREALERSLGAVDLALQGDSLQAGRVMAALEWEQAGQADVHLSQHPLVIGLDRLAGARWLAASGDADQAMRLLRWVDGAFFIHPSTVYSLMLSGLANFERGRIEDRLGNTDAAAEFYREFLLRCDRPVPRLTALIDEARARAGTPVRPLTARRTP